jgi:sorbitol-specific phosphotransferase system component IIA
MMSDPSVVSSLEGKSSKDQPSAPKNRYHSVIVEMNIEIPEDLEDDLVAVLNHGGLSPDQAESVALILVHAPLSENPVLVNSLGLNEHQYLITDITDGY